MFHRTTNYIEYALLAADVYNAASNNLKNIPAGWKRSYEHKRKHVNSALWHFNSDNVVDKFIPGKSLNKKFKENEQQKKDYYAEQIDTFFGRLYIKRSTNETVVAIRGTQKFNDYISDIKLALKQESSHDNIARNFYNEVMQFLFAKENFSLSKFPVFTGHSLGGYLAQLIAVEFNVPAVVFNAPKIGGFHDLYLKKRIDPHERHDNVINIDVDYDDIHKIGSRIGSTHMLHGDDECNSPIINATLAKHVINDIDTIYNPAFLSAPELTNLIAQTLNCKLKEHSINGVARALNREPAFANSVPFSTV